MGERFEYFLRSLNNRDDVVALHDLPFIGTVKCRLTGDNRNVVVHVIGNSFRTAAQGEIASASVLDSLQCTGSLLPSGLRIFVYLRVPLFAQSPQAQPSKGTEGTGAHATVTDANDVLDLQIIPQVRIQVDLGVEWMNAINICQT